jgi:CMP/dCMP kinase
MIITISGTPGSGKTCIAKSLAKKLGYQFHSVGDARGKYAAEHGMSINDLNKQAEEDPRSDFMEDDYLKELAEGKGDFVIDARLGFFFIPKSIKVFLDSDEDVRSVRVYNEKREDEHYSSPDEAKIALAERQRSDIKRYRALYKVNPYEESHYDLVLDTTNKTVEQSAGDIYRFIMFRKNALNTDSKD